MPRMERRHDIDWLRVLAMLAVFVFHCTRFFDNEGWHLKNAEQSFMLFILMRGFMWPWLMEIFFLLSGVGAWYLLRTRSAGGFVVDRAKRLLIPLYTVGLVILMPPQYYFELITNEGYKGGFWQCVPGLFRRVGFPRLTAWPTTLFNLAFGGHLWFLKFLFLISSRDSSAAPLSEVAARSSLDRCARRASALAGAASSCSLIPLALTLVILRRVSGRTGMGRVRLVRDLFVLGYIIPADGRFTDAFKRHGWVGLPLWLVGFFGGIAVLVLGLKYDPAPGAEPFSLQYVLFQVIWAVASWGSVVFLLGLGRALSEFQQPRARLRRTRRCSRSTCSIRRSFSSWAISSFAGPSSPRSSSS